MTQSGYQLWDLPGPGIYKITVQGAQGGGTSFYKNYEGGRGAIMQGTFTLEGGKLVILVGQQGESCSHRLGDKFFFDQ